MTFPIRTERDVGLVNWATEVAGWATTLVGANSLTLRFRNSAVVHVDHAISEQLGAVTLAANEQTSGGIHITGPLDSEAFTLYSYDCMAWTEDKEISPLFFVGVSSATPTSSAAGEIITNVRYIHGAQSHGDDHVCMEAKGTIGLPLPFTELGGGFENRAVCFGVAFMTGLNAATAGSHCFARMSVRRLVGKLPEVHDKFKLG